MLEKHPLFFEAISGDFADLPQLSYLKKVKPHRNLAHQEMFLQGNHFFFLKCYFCLFLCSFKYNFYSVLWIINGAERCASMVECT